jgi:hypothetical protein
MVVQRKFTLVFTQSHLSAKHIIGGIGYQGGVKPDMTVVGVVAQGVCIEPPPAIVRSVSPACTVMQLRSNDWLGESHGSGTH